MKTAVFRSLRPAAIICCVLIALLGFHPSAAPGFGHPSAALASGEGAREATPEGSARQACWIYWAPEWEADASRERVALSPRALARMRRCGADTTTLEPGNRAVPQGFLAHLATLGIRPRVASRFLRAVSAELDDAGRSALETDPGVARVLPVLQFRRPRTEAEPALSGHSGFFAKAETLPDPRSLLPSDYGRSYGQLRRIGVTDLHRLGYSGRGVLVCLLDSGYHTSHDAFRLARLVATRDFVGGDSIVSYEPADTSEPYNTPRMELHGTLTWSTLGGFDRGLACGPAYGASFALGRTEIAEVEIRIEEDYYVAGLEWADSLGAEVVSTSLGYLSFEDGFSYTPDQLDGHTAVTSRGAEWLARRGVLLVTAMGNDGPDPSTLITPADAESVISVGAVDSSGVLVRFSSRGPTADGRIKPDVCAQGLETWCAMAAGNSSFGRADGTSLSTPLIGGLAALLREAHPEWGIDRLRAALRGAGDQAQSPDDDRGWGVPDGLKAIGTEISDLEVATASWLRSGAAGIPSDSIASPGDSGSVLLVLRNLGSEPGAPAWVSLVGGQGLRAARDSVRIGPIPPGASAPLPRPLGLAVSSSFPVPLEADIIARVDPEGGGFFFLRGRLPVRPLVVRNMAYPNPLVRGGVLTLELHPTDRAPLSLDVLDAAGRLVDRPFEAVAAGTLEAVHWIPPARLASGVYWLCLRSGAQTHGYRVVLLK